MFVDANKATSSSRSFVTLWLLTTAFLLSILASSIPATSANSLSNSAGTDRTEQPRGLEALLGKERSEHFINDVWGKDSWEHFPAYSSSPSYEDLWSLALVEYHLKNSHYRPWAYDKGRWTSKHSNQATFVFGPSLKLSFSHFPSCTDWNLCCCLCLLWYHLKILNLSRKVRPSLNLPNQPDGPTWCTVESWAEVLV